MTVTLLRIDEFADALKITPACVRRWIAERKVGVVHVGRLVRIPETEVERLITAGSRPAKGEGHGGRTS